MKDVTELLAVHEHVLAVGVQVAQAAGPSSRGVPLVDAELLVLSHRHSVFDVHVRGRELRLLVVERRS